MRAMNENSKKRWRHRGFSMSVVVCVAMLMGYVNTRLGTAQIAEGPQDDPIPVLDIDTPEKAIVARFAFTGQQTAEVLSLEVVESPAHIKGSDPFLLSVRLGFQGRPDNLCPVTLRDQVPVCYDTWHPSWAGIHEEPGEIPVPRHRIELLPTSTARIVLPFYPEMTTITLVYPPTGAEIITVDARPAIRSFCLQNLTDGDCDVDLGTTKTGPSVAVAGTEVTYTVDLVNFNSDPGQRASVVDTLPVGMTFVSGTPGCSTSGAEVVCDVGRLASAGSVPVSITVRIDPALVHEAGGPTTITNVAESRNSAGVDPRPENDASSVTTLVRAEADLQIVDASVPSAPAELVIGAPTEITVRKILTSSGPSSPMDAVLSWDGESTGGTVSGPARTPVTALEDGELRTVEELFTVRCEEPGVHSFSFQNRVSPADEGNSDPNSSNNTAITGFEAECIETTAINIHPRSFPNSINLSGEIIPVGILTTEAGEYGLSRAFDATRIDPLTVRFGPKSVLLAGLGASEVHRAAHFEDSVELDERTRDRDLDVLMHFRTSETGIGIGSTEACVLGEWLDDGGMRHTFFGCDSVRVVQ